MKLHVIYSCRVTAVRILRSTIRIDRCRIDSSDKILWAARRRIRRYRRRRRVLTLRQLRERQPAAGQANCSAHCVECWSTSSFALQRTELVHAAAARGTSGPTSSSSVLESRVRLARDLVVSAKWSRRPNNPCALNGCCVLDTMCKPHANTRLRPGQPRDQPEGLTTRPNP